MTNDGCDLQCTPELNRLLNRLFTNCETDYSVNQYMYTARKVDPYTAIETNITTGKQRVFKSSVCIY